MIKNNIQVRSKVWLEVFGRPVLGPGRRELLRAVDEQGSISAAARLLRISYRKAWGQIKAMETDFGLRLVSLQAGGPRGGGAQLTSDARNLLAKYDLLTDGLEEQVNHKFKGIFL